MKKSQLLYVSLFICAILCLPLSTSYAAPNQSISVAWADYTPGNVIGYGQPADHEYFAMFIMNTANQRMNNIRFTFYDLQGNNVTKGGTYYQYPSEIPALGSVPINLTQLVQNQSNNNACSIKITWDGGGNVKPFVYLRIIIQDINDSFLQMLVIPVSNPN